MIKKVLLLLALLMPVAAVAQYTNGSWVLHPTFAPAQAQNCIDTGDKIYYLASGSLYCLDKETNENEAYSKNNYLSDGTAIQGIYYNYDKHYLAIVYVNSNIDFITAEGRMVNMPEIKDAILTSSKIINDVTFTNKNEMYLATDFGYVVVDDTRFVIKESHIYYKPFNSIARVGEKLVAVIENVVHISNVSAQHDALSSFVATTSTLTSCKLYQLNDSKVFMYTPTYLYVGTPGGTAESPKVTLKSIVKATCTCVQRTPSGFIANFLSGGFYYTFDADGNDATRVDAGNEIFTVSPSGEMWALGDNGLHKASGASDYYKPNAISISTLPFWSVYDPAKNLYYLQTSADNFLLTSSKDANVMEINTYDGTTWRNVTPDKLGEGNYYSGWQLVVNPNDANTYFFGTRDRGIYKVTNGVTKDIFCYNNNNNPDQPVYNMPTARYRGATAFDTEGNLWVVASGGTSDASNYYNSTSRSNVIALPKDKVNSTTAVKTSDWKLVKVNLWSGEFKRASFVINKDNIKLYNDGGYESNTFVWREGINTLNPNVRTIKNLIDQDGKAITWTYLRGMTADLNGHIWMGLNSVVEFDPNDIFTDNFRVNRIKVPRNDGTGLADYLLDGMSVNCIAVDALNRKWIGTTTGLYHVSADGTQVLKEFNTSNSMLPSDNVFSIACNTTDNTVLVVTGGGVLEYVESSSSSVVTLDNVTCYPNPVRPDYTGLLTISGLPDGTLVKIADSAGNVVKQLQGSGGIATWDCCGANGDRVATGVYYVLVSTSGGQSSNIVSKFLVVK